MLYVNFLSKIAPYFRACYYFSMSKNDSETTSSDRRAQQAQQVKAVRLAQGMTQQALADAAGVTRQTVSNLERGTVPQAAILTRILDILGMTPTATNEDTRMWLGILEGMLNQLPTPSRNRAGQAAVNAVAAEMASTATNVRGDSEDDQSGYGLAARPRARDRGEDVL